MHLRFKHREGMNLAGVTTLAVRYRLNKVLFVLVGEKNILARFPPQHTVEDTLALHVSTPRSLLATRNYSTEVHNPAATPRKFIRR